MTKERKIKFTAIAIRWFDKVNGNTYHSVRVIRHRDGKIIAAPFQYGYGDSYQQTSLEIMSKNKWLPPKYRQVDEKSHHPYFFAYERENNYPILWNVRDGLKRECVANGEID